MGEKGIKKAKHKNILSVPPLDMPKLRGLGSTFFYKMLEYKEKTAQTDAISGEKQTYGLVLQKSIRAAIAMRSMGLQPNDVITICAYNHLDCMIPYYGSLFLGALSANLDPAVPLSDTIYLLKLVRPKMIFAAPEAVKLMEETLRETGIDAIIVVFGKTLNHIEFSELLIPSPEEENFVPYEVEDLKSTATIVFSSGTTGLPKGVCLTHYGLLGYTYNGILSVPGATTVLVYPNLYWITSISFIVSIIIHGLNRVFYPKFDASTAWDVISKNKVNVVSLNPHQMIGMCKNGRPQGIDTSSLQHAFLGGGPVPKDLVRTARECLPGTLVVTGYGQTEQNGPTMCFRVDHIKNERQLLEEKPDSIGKPQPGYSYKIVDPETEEILGPNQEGELRIKTEFAMNGYYNMDSSDVWDADGFMKTGDVAYYDDDHCFYIVDRIKDLMKYQMWHISPAKLEAIFHTHPAVQMAIVTSIPHPVDGDHLMGLVVLKESAVGKVTEEELQKYVDDKVGEQQRLRAGVKFVENLPVTVTGKFNRRAIKQLVQQGKL